MELPVRVDMYIYINLSIYIVIKPIPLGIFIRLLCGTKKRKILDHRRKNSQNRMDVGLFPISNAKDTGCGPGCEIILKSHFLFQQRN